MGSDWPHAEGLREPGEFYHRLSSLDDKTRRDFLRENGLKLFEGID
jgi:predicted TIM-barrel fold metal-dependent hydrolase